MNYTEFKEQIIKAAKEQKLDEYEIYYTKQQSISTETLIHEVSAFETAENAGVCFRCIYGGKMGYASTELFTWEEAQRLVLAAMEHAKTIESEDEVFLHEAGDQYVKMEGQKTTKPSSAQLIEKALEIEKALYEVDERVMDGSRAFVGFGEETVGLYNSKGLDLSYQYDCSTFGAMAAVKEGEEMYNAYEVRVGDYEKIEADTIAKRAVQDAIASIGTESVESGTYQVVFSNKVMRNMLATFYEVFSAESVQHGLSLLKDKEGEQIASEIVSIMDDPFCKEAYNGMPFDSEGVATYCKAVIEEGILKTLLYNLTTAHKAGVKSTGNGRKSNYASAVSVKPYNFYLENGTITKEELFKKVGNGIYVTEINGLHAGANAVTGDFSLAAEGFLIAEGKCANAVKNFTVSDNFYEMLKKVVEIGDDLSFSPARGGCTFGAPSVWIRDLSVAGK